MECHAHASNYEPTKAGRDKQQGDKKGFRAKRK